MSYSAEDEPIREPTLGLLPSLRFSSATVFACVDIILTVFLGRCGAAFFTSFEGFRVFDGVVNLDPITLGVLLLAEDWVGAVADDLRSVTGLSDCSLTGVLFGVLGLA